MKAKYYIYRNLNKGGFSVRYKGKVICVSNNIQASGVEFKVSKKGRERAIKFGIRNVHAYAACCSYYLRPELLGKMKGHRSIWYNPFQTDTFRIGKNGILSIKSAIIAHFIDNKCYL